MLINFPISWLLIPMANCNLKLRASVSTELRLMLEMLTRSALLKSFQQLLLHKDINLDLSLEMWLLFIQDISDLSCSAMLKDIPCFRRSFNLISLAFSNVCVCYIIAEGSFLYYQFSFYISYLSV